MNCDLVQRRLMSSEEPSSVPADLRAHLTTCGSCRDWQRHLAQIERNIPLLPVPRSRGRSRLLKQFLPEKARDRQAAADHEAGPTTAEPRVLPVPRVLLVLRLTAGTAAAFLVLVLGIRFFQSFQRAPADGSDPIPIVQPAADPLLAGLVRHDLRLATVATPRERIAILADVADEILDPARALAGETAGNQLEVLARLYERVIREGIVEQARALPAGDRRSILAPIAERLARTARQIDRLLQKVSPEKSRPLQNMGSAAREGNRRLYTLVAEVRS